VKKAAAALCVLAVMSAACGEATQDENAVAGDPPGGTPITITATDFAFSETTISLDAGEAAVLTL